MTEPSKIQEPTLLERLMAISRASALEEMASGIAHELNQPLGAIVTFAQAGERMLSRPDAPPGSVLEVLQLISKEALSAAAGIQRMRQRFHRDTLDRIPCSLTDVVRELRAVIDVLAEQAGVRLILDVDENLPLVSVDPLRIQHLLLTLVQNAIDASCAAQDGAITPQVRIEAHSDRYGVEASVTDNGRGIAQEHRSHVFHPFFTTKLHGTGLGLASARAIIEAHEGTIGFDPLPERGTRFWFRLPNYENSSAP